MRYILLAFLLAGCASVSEPEYARYAECTLPITREVGMGLRVNGCAAWQFGPSREQRARWARDHGK